MTNSDNYVILNEIINSVASVYKWKDFYNPKFKKVVEVPDSILSRYVGKYMLFTDTVSLSIVNHKLLLQYRKITYKPFFTSNLEFFIPELEGDNKFLKDTEGKVKGISINNQITLNKVE